MRYRGIYINLKLLCGFSFLTESIPRSLRISKVKGNAAIGGKYIIIIATPILHCSYNIYVGTYLSFYHEDKNLFVVGAEKSSNINAVTSS